MIAIGCASSDERGFEAGAARAVESIAESSSLLLRRHAEPIDRAYNEMLEEAASRADLEAVVLLDQDLSIAGDFLTPVRELLAASPDIAVVGAFGVRHAPGRPWWEGKRYGRLDCPLLVPGGLRRRYSSGAHEVDFVDGMALVLSSWAARELRFDADLPDQIDLHAADLCMQARACGRRVVASSALRVTSYRTYVGSMNRRRWLDAAVALRRKWAISAC
jgi:hypothetical protein